jgi:hypothetical protein
MRKEFINVTPEALKSLTPDAFEQLVASLLAATGFRNVVSLGGSGDEGIDLRAEWLEELPTIQPRVLPRNTASIGARHNFVKNSRRFSLKITP